MATIATLINLLDEASRSGIEPFVLARALVAVHGALPRTFYLSASTDLRGTFEIPAAWTLQMAPGAILRLGADGSLVVRGPIDLGVGPHFHCPHSGPRIERGSVRLAGPLDSIEADWWTPRLEVEDLVPDGSSVAQALEALWWRYRHGDLPAPIQLRGPYLLDVPLIIDPPDGGFYDVALRGEALCSSMPTLRSAGGTRALFALVQVTANVALLADDIVFDAGPSDSGRANVGLHLFGAREGSRLSGCSFHVPPGGVGVKVEVPSPNFPERAERSRLQVERCLFFADAGLPMRAALAVGPLGPLQLRISDSLFEGPALAMISLFGGDVAITACSFDNLYDPPVDALEQDGCDVLFVQLTLAEQRRLRSIGEPSTWLTVTHCTSSSPSFLFGQTATQDPLQGEPGGAVITGLRHAPSVSRASLGPRSIRWRAGFGPRALLLQACQLGGSVVIDASAPPGEVVDLGVRFVRRDPVAPPPAFMAVTADGSRLTLVTDARVVRIDTPPL